MQRMPFSVELGITYDKCAHFGCTYSLALAYAPFSTKTDYFAANCLPRSMNHSWHQQVNKSSKSGKAIFKKYSGRTNIHGCTPNQKSDNVGIHVLRVY